MLFFHVNWWLLRSRESMYVQMDTERNVRTDGHRTKLWRNFQPIVSPLEESFTRIVNVPGNLSRRGNANGMPMAPCLQV